VGTTAPRCACAGRPLVDANRLVLVWSLVVAMTLLWCVGCRHQNGLAAGQSKSEARPVAAEAVAASADLALRPESPAPPPTASKSPAPNGGPASSTAWSINEAGLVVGGSDTSEGVEHAFLWTPGDPVTGAAAKMEDLAKLDGSELGASQAHGINDDGLVVGWVAKPAGREAFVWDLATRRMRLLPEMWRGADTRPNAINKHGLVVGNSNMNPVLWDLKREPVVCHALGGAVDAIHGTWACDVSDRNEIVGWGTQLNQSHVGFLSAWDRKRGRSTALPFDVSNWSPVALNEHRDIAGYMDEDAVLWRMEKAQFVRLPRPEGATRASANGVNAEAMVVGTYESKDGTKHACEWHFEYCESPYLDSSVVKTLPALGEPECGSLAAAVNDKGQIAGKSETAPGSKVFHACLWERDEKGEWSIRDLGTLP